MADRILAGKDPVEDKAADDGHLCAGENDPLVPQTLNDLERFLKRWLPRFEKQDRAYVTVAIGCTGGQHRSVYVVEKLAKRFAGKYEPVVVKHKDLP